MKRLDFLDGVLVVEDEVVLALDIEDQLFELGLRRIYLAHSSAVGKEFLESKTINLAILDVNLGRTLVFPLAEEIRARRIPIIFATAFLRDGFPPEWRGNPVLSKPFDRTALRNAISQLARDMEDGSRL